MTGASLDSELYVERFLCTVADHCRSVTEFIDLEDDTFISKADRRIIIHETQR